MLRDALAPPRWALGVHRRHLALVTAICAVPAAERFTGQLWQRPHPLGPILEIVTLAARITLLVVMTRIVLTGDPRLANLQPDEVTRRLHGYLLRHPLHALGQFASIALLGVLADVLPEKVVPTLVEVGPLYWAVLLGAKNLTVIPFTMIWLAEWLRYALLAGAERSGEPEPASR